MPRKHQVSTKRDTGQVWKGSQRLCQWLCGNGSAARNVEYSQAWQQRSQLHQLRPLQPAAVPQLELRHMGSGFGDAQHAGRLQTVGAVQRDAREARVRARACHNSSGSVAKAAAVVARPGICC